MPAVGSTAIASVASGGAAQFNLGNFVFISPIGYLSITAINTGTDLVTRSIRHRVQLRPVEQLSQPPGRLALRALLGRKAIPE
jgi:hypothetical protein